MPAPRSWRTPALTALLAVAAAAPLQAANQVDILFVYPQSVIDYAGDINTRLNHYIAQSNLAYQTSDVDIQLRLVGGHKSNNSAYGTVGNTALDAATYRDTEVHALREKLGADFVGVLSRGNGSLCGVGWLGNSQNGKITKTSMDMAYTSSSIDCGPLTFTHELGHNMGLMHSRRQGDTSGGHHPYGMGYGVDGKFATIMAYAYLFNTQYIYRFSNARQTDCKGLTCGDAATADASRSLALMANQYAIYRKGTGGDDGGGDDGGGGNADPVIEVPRTPANVLDNGSFESGTTGWSSAYNGSIATSTLRRHGGQQGLEISGRSNYASGVSHSLTGKLDAAGRYHFAASVRLTGTASDTVKAVLEINGGQKYIELGRFGATDKWSRIEAEFAPKDLPSGAQVSLLLYGPATGVTMYIDSVSIEPLLHIPPAEILHNGGFEQGNALSWSLSYGGRMDVVAGGYQSARCLQVSRRGARHDGIGQILTSLQPGQRYRANARVRVPAGEDRAELWLQIRDDAGRRWQRIGAARVGNVWSPLSADFSVTARGRLQSVSLHVMGPQAGRTFQVDQLSLQTR